jgi:GT2 family glycosyltransferase
MNMNDKPLASVIVVNYNGKQYLKRCMDSLLGQTYTKVEIILVDNGSSDGSIELVRESYPSVRVVENRENLGFAIANNIGIRAARGEFIATLNNDTEAMPGWIEAMVNAAVSSELIGMCASKMLFMKNPDVIDSTGLCISRSGACWDRGMFEHDNGQFTSTEEVFGPCAGAAIYKRKMLEEIGLFDEDFYAYMEDVDLAFRGRLAGWICIYAPEAIVYHVHGGTAGYGSDFTVYYGNRNIIWNAVKNYPMPLLITSLPFIIGRNLGVIPYYMFRGYCITILRSKIDAIKGIPRMFAKRKRLHSAGRKIEGFIKTWANMPRAAKDEAPGVISKGRNIGNVK